MVLRRGARPLQHACGSMLVAADLDVALLCLRHSKGPVRIQGSEGLGLRFRGQGLGARNLGVEGCPSFFRPTPGLRGSLLPRPLFGHLDNKRHDPQTKTQKPPKPKTPNDH